ncbi:DUF4959 domain-containing protein, partial [Bacteroides faecichinchillae]
MRTKIYTYLLGLLVICTSFLTSCGEADLNEASGKKVAPQQVTVREVKNLNGGAIIYYTLPDDPNLKYVRAV